MSDRGGARPKDFVPLNTRGRKNSDDSDFEEQREGSRGGSRSGYDREAPQSRDAQGYDREVPQSRGAKEFARRATQSRGAEEFARRATQSHRKYGKGASASRSPIGSGWQASGLFDPKRDFCRGGQKQGQEVKGSDISHSIGDQGHGRGDESRPQASGQHQARHSDTRQGDGDVQDIKQLEENMGKMAVSKQPGKQLSLAGRRGDLADKPSEGPVHEVVGHGTAGDRLEIVTNLFQFKVTKTLYQYSIEFYPSFESARLKLAIIKSIEKELVLTSYYVTDGSILCTTELLNANLDIEASFKGGAYKVTVKYMATIEPASSLGIKILNVIFGRYLQNKGWKWSDGSYYDYSQMIPIRETRYSVYPGFFTSILELESGIWLKLHVSHQILSNQNVWKGSQCQLSTLETRVIGKTVFTCYNAKTYKVEEVDFTKTVNSAFQYKGEDTTIKDYYRQKYGVTITDDKQPLLIVKRYRDLTSGTPDVMYLVPELCIVTGIDKKDLCNGALMKKVYSVTKPNPNIRARKMEDFVTNIQEDLPFINIMKSFGVVLESTMASVVGRELPVVQYSKMISGFSRPAPRITGPLRNWVVIHPANQRHVETFLSNLYKSMRLLGLTFSDPVISGYQDYHDLVRLLSDIPSNNNLVIVISQGYNQGEYRTIKRILCLTNPIPSQVVTTRLVEDANFDCTKIAVQIICKMGGAGWALYNMNAQETMVIGVNVYIGQQGVYFVGFVATMDDRCSEHYTTWCKTKNSAQYANQLGQVITECMNAYCRRNGRHCTRVVVYRSGIFDDHLEDFMKTEVKQTEKAITEFHLNTKLVYIIINEKDRSLFFLVRRGRDGSTYENVDRRIVVDEKVTRPGWTDFFIVRKVVKDAPGMLAPTHFNVVLNSSDMAIDSIQILTHQLCFLYFNLLGTVSVPAVCRYAHMVASMIAQDLDGQLPSDRLKDRLFYL